MIDTTATLLAFRNRALGTTVCTTGSTSLSATTTGYARAAGSFVTDGFAVGMEVTASGFSTAANNGTGLVTAVTALALTVTAYDVSSAMLVTARTLAVEVAAAGRTISVVLPALRAWENTAFKPVAGYPYVADEIVPTTSSQTSAPYAGGTVEETGLYYLKIFGLENTGASAIHKTVDAIKLRFSPGTSLTSGSDTVKVRGDVGPIGGQLLPQGDGWSVRSLPVPYRAYTVNTVAA